jgi:GT2 family glycosyltransferase
MVLIAVEHNFKVHHIPKVLYHEKQRNISEIKDNKSNIQALRKAIGRRGISATILEGKRLGSCRIQYEIINDPLVSIVIPFKDQPKLLVMCIESILEKTTYRNFEIIGISNGSTDQKVFREMERLAELDSRVVFHEYNVPFNYSEINNYAVKQFVNGKHILFLNNDIEVISPSWLESMLEHSQRDEVGAVGAKLYFPDGSIQHAGVIMGKGDWHGLGHGVAGHAYSHIDERNEFCDYRRSLNVVSNYHAVTAACTMVERRLFDSVGGFNEVDLKVAFNDVDFCLRLEAMGKLNVYTPFAELYHHESVSRGNDAYDEEKQKRYEKEANYMLSQYLDVIKEDRYYNRNLSLIDETWLKEAQK